MVSFMNIISVDFATGRTTRRSFTVPSSTKAGMKADSSSSLK